MTNPFRHGLGEVPRTGTSTVLVNARNAVLIPDDGFRGDVLEKPTLAEELFEHVETA